VLPLSYVALNAMALLALALLFTAASPAFLPFVWIGVACIACLSAYVLRGWQLSGIGAQGLLDLARAPFFLVWKLMLMLRRGNDRAWVRTDRETP
jgi:hypothetical protein